MSFRTKMSESLRNIYESNKKEGTVEIVRESLSSGKMKPEDFSLQELWDAFERDAKGYTRSVNEAVSSDMFPTITGELISNKVIAGYNMVQTIGDKLTTTMPSNLKVDTIVGFGASEGPDEVPEGHAYNDSSIDEKWVTIDHTKYGRIIRVTEEAIQFDRTGQLLMRAQRIGEKAAQYKEQLIVEGVQDVNSDVFNPSGAAAAYYRTSASGDRKINSRASTPFGEDGLKEAMNLMHDMTDEEDDYISLTLGPLYLLVPYDLWVQASQMLKSTLVPEGTENAVNVWKGMFTILTSPYISAQSPTTWYIGDFARDFVWSEIWPLQTFTLRPGSTVEFDRDIKSSHKVRFYGNIGAIDDKAGYKLTA